MLPQQKAATILMDGIDIEQDDEGQSRWHCVNYLFLHASRAILTLLA